MVLAVARPEVGNVILQVLAKVYHLLIATPTQDLPELCLRLKPRLLILELGTEHLASPRSLMSLRADLRLGGLSILALSEDKSERISLAALEAGADDFIALPIKTGELAARVKALLRRGARVLAGELKAGGLELDLGARRARIDGRGLKLTRTEFLILVELIRRLGAVVAKAALASYVWGGREISLHTLDSHVCNLRRKLGRRSGLIENVYGGGYRLAP